MFALLVISLASSTPLRFLSRPSSSRAPPAGQGPLGSAASSLTRTAALCPFRLVAVQVPVLPLQTTNWLELHTYQTSPSFGREQRGSPATVSANEMLGTSLVCSERTGSEEHAPKLDRAPRPSA